MAHRLAVLLMMALAAFGSTARPAPAAEAEGPACVRIPLGSGRACLRLGWYVGLWRAIDERSLEVGVRLTLGGTPPARAEGAPLQPPAGVVPFEPPAHPLPNLPGRLATAVAAYGLLPLSGGLERFIGGEAAPTPAATAP